MIPELTFLVLRLNARFGRFIDRQVVGYDLEQVVIGLLEHNTLEKAHIKARTVSAIFMSHLERQTNLIELKVGFTGMMVSRMHKLEEYTIIERVRNGKKRELVERKMISQKRVTREHGSFYESLNATHVELRVNNSWTQATLDAELCALDPGVLNLRILASSQFTQNGWVWPQCTNAWTSLQVLTITNTPLPNFDLLPKTLITVDLTFLEMPRTSLAALTGSMGTALKSLRLDYSVSKMTYSPGDFAGQTLNPCSALEKLSLLRAINFTGGATLDDFISDVAICTNLKTLTLDQNELSGSLPIDTFTVHLPGLENFNIADNQIVGTVPYLWSDNLLCVDFMRNNLTSWTHLAPPGVDWSTETTSIETIRLMLNKLVDMPSNEVLPSAPELQTLVIFDNPDLRGPFPTPWPTQEQVDAMTHEERSSMKFWFLYVDRCALEGDLPDFPIGLSNENSVPLRFYLAENNFTGTIPSSWSNFIWTLALLSRNTGLNGTIPALPGTNLTDYSEYWLDVSYTSISGALFNLDVARIEENFRTILNLYCSQVDACDTSNTLIS